MGLRFLQCRQLQLLIPVAFALISLSYLWLREFSPRLIAFFTFMGLRFLQRRQLQPLIPVAFALISLSYLWRCEF